MKIGALLVAVDDTTSPPENILIANKKIYSVLFYLPASLVRAKWYTSRNLNKNNKNIKRFSRVDLPKHNY